MDSEKVGRYIESLCEGKKDLARREFIEKTGWKDFTPVGDGVIFAVKK